MSILDFVPEWADRKEGCLRWQNQKSQLLRIEKNWNKYDIFVSNSSVGSGKTIILQTIARWRASKDESSATITHRINLMNQHQKDFPEVPVLKGRSHYTCGEGVGSCEDHYELFESYCEDCKYKKVKAAATGSNNAMFNYQSYIYNQAFKQNLYLDEADQCFDIIAEMFSIKLWKHLYKYPKARTHGDVAIWLEGEITKLQEERAIISKRMGKNRFLNKKSHKLSKAAAVLMKEYQLVSRQIRKFKRVLMGLQRSPGNFFIEEVYENYRGVKRKALQVRPTTLTDLPDRLWPEEHTKKIVLMSGTIRDIDLRKMGLLGRRIYYVDTIDPIPSDRKPIIVENKLNMSFKYQDKNIIPFAEQIEDIISRHPDTKGIVHMTYSLAEKVRPYLNSNSRIIFHDKDNKDDKLKHFLACKEPIVLVGCGMGVGLDLDGPEYSFQIIGKIMWPNKKDKLINYLYEKQIERIKWDTCKTVIQQWGRICRSPEDYGVTYIIDSAFGNPKKKRFGLFQQCKQYFGKSFIDSITWR